MNLKENKGLIIIIVGIICSITLYGIFIGIPLIIIGTYLLNKKVSNEEKEIDDKLKEKQDEINNIDVKLNELEEQKEKEINENLKIKNDELTNIDTKLKDLEEQKEKEINTKLKEKQDELNNINTKLDELKKQKERDINNEIKYKHGELENLKTQIKNMKKELICLEDEAETQDLGIYPPKYDCMTSLEYKEKLEKIRDQQKQHLKNKTAAICETTWTLNGDKKQGQAFAKANVDQILLNFNLECEMITSKVTTSNINTSTEKIRRFYNKLNKMNKRNSVKITETYLNLKLEELNIAYKYELKKQEEKEILREEKEKEKEEKKIQKQLDKEKNKFEKDNQDINNDINNKQQEIEKAKSNEEKQKLEQEIKELKEALAKNNQEIENIEEKKEQTGAGYVYIISNIGSFGEDIYKIGVTRRDDPQDRINELSNASVPFKYDAHAFIFSKDAYGLEKALHDKFDNRRVNKINRRKEFFKIDMGEVKEIVDKHKSEVHSFIETPEAQEYRESLKMQKQNA